jgi:hypothetical protein
MTVEDNTIVDAVGVDVGSGHVVLTISDHLDWDDEQDHLRTLQEKVNLYLAFIESGELVMKYPQAAGRHPRIDVVFRTRPSGRALGFLETVRKTIESAAIGFGWRTFSGAG